MYIGFIILCTFEPGYPHPPSTPKLDRELSPMCQDRTLVLITSYNHDALQDRAIRGAK